MPPHMEAHPEQTAPCCWACQCVPCPAGMVHNKHRISKQQAAAMGMLTSEAGLAAMHAVLAAQHAQRAAVLGAASQGYWRALLAGVQQLPHMYQAIELNQVAPAQQQLEAAPVAAQAAGQPAKAAAARAAPTSADVEAAVQQVVFSVLGSAAIDPDQPLATQGMDSLAGLELRQKIQDQLGVELMVLVEDPQTATIRRIVAEATPQLAAAHAAAVAAGQQQPVAVHVSAYAGSAANAAVGAAPGWQVQQQQQRQQAAAVTGPLWVSPAPVSVKMRIFCLPYAGDVSEKVFAR